MAGARTVEEILARGGAEQFDDHHVRRRAVRQLQPHHALPRAVRRGGPTRTSSSTPLAWYAENDITLHAGVRVDRIDRFAKVVFADDGQVTPYDKLIIATGSRSFMPPIDGLQHRRRRAAARASSRSAPSTTPAAMIAYAQHDDHRKAVVIGGGLLGLEAARGLQATASQVDVVHAGAHLMNAQLGPGRRRRSCGGAWSSSASRCITRHPDHRDHGRATRSAASGCGTSRELDCDMVVVAAGIRPNVELAVDQRLHRRAGDRRRRPDAHRRTTTTSTRSASASSTAARSTAWSRRCGSRPWCSPTTSPAPTRTPPTTARGPPPSSRSPASTSPRWACTGPERDTDEHIVFSEPQRGRLQVARHPRRQARRRHPARRQQQGRVPDAGVRPRAAAARGAGRAAVRPRRPGGGGRRRRAAPTTPRSATATASARARSSARVQRRLQDRRRR